MQGPESRHTETATGRYAVFAGPRSGRPARCLGATRLRADSLRQTPAVARGMSRGVAPAAQAFTSTTCSKPPKIMRLPSNGKFFGSIGMRVSFMTLATTLSRCLRER